jgi:hypothetical protein
VLRDRSVDIQVTNLNTGLNTTFSQAFRYGVQLQVTGLQPDVVDAEESGAGDDLRQRLRVAAGRMLGGSTESSSRSSL